MSRSILVGLAAIHTFHEQNYGDKPVRSGVLVLEDIGWDVPDMPKDMIFPAEADETLINLTCRLYFGQRPASFEGIHHDTPPVIKDAWIVGIHNFIPFIYRRHGNALHIRFIVGQSMVSVVYVSGELVDINDSSKTGLMQTVYAMCH